MRSKQAPSWLPLVFLRKTRAARDYSQGKRRTQGKTAKKAGKMLVFGRDVEITAKNGVGTHMRHYIAARTSQFCEMRGSFLPDSTQFKPAGREVLPLVYGSGSVKK
jgi:hypothetical protein